jgi:aspartate kinase
MLIVQKFGGATLSDAKKIRRVAERIAQQARAGHQVVAVVSAMGSTTNELISLAGQVSPTPALREMDMLLSVGERISMALLSMALLDVGIKAVSLTGSQAGILTDDSHSNAFIQDIKASRVQEALTKNAVVVVAGFQGVSPVTKEITTLGRGGTDTTAIAMTAFLKAHHCEILKDVSAVYSADPRLVPEAKALRELTYEQMAEMTFWGAKVLHYRSVELALREQVSIYVGPAQEISDGTWIRSKGSLMYEKVGILSLNSFEKVLRLRSSRAELTSAFSELEKNWSQSQIPSPQLLSIEQIGQACEVWVTGPREILAAIEKWVTTQKDWSLETGNLSSVTVTCAGTTSAPLIEQILSQLRDEKIKPLVCRWTSLGLSIFVHADDRVRTIQTLHSLIR